jgi:hypothetical protein
MVSALDEPTVVQSGLIAEAAMAYVPRARV